MHDFQDATIQSIIVHGVGNKSREEGMRLSKKMVDLAENPVGDVLHKYFLSPFKNDAVYQFSHDTDISLNEIYIYAKAIFADPWVLPLQSANIAKHLYECSDHPMIKEGELYVVYFRGCYFDAEETDAIGIFKSETKETYMKVLFQNDGADINTEEGIDIRKLDKGCIIFNQESENGFLVSIVDNTNKNEEARFWVDSFLRIKHREDDYHKTQQYMEVCRSFVKDVFNTSNNIAKPDQIELLNRSKDYFLKNHSFVQEDFEEKVIGQPEVIEAFKEYREQYVEQHQIELPEDNFEINYQAAKKNSSMFKSVLKLDKNFTLYIHGNRNQLERGYDDEKQSNYYKLFYIDEK